MSLFVDSRQAEQEHFDRLATELGEAWWGDRTPAGIERFRRRARMLARALADRADLGVLELGCGAGGFSRYLLAERPGLRLLGLDLSPRLVDLAIERLQPLHPGALFRVGDVTTLDQPQESYDAVVGNSILHHVALAPALAAAFRVLRPGGLLWFSEPNMRNPQVFLERKVRWIGRWLRNSADETAFVHRGLRRAVQRAGFRDVAVRPYEFLHPLVPRLLIRPAVAAGLILERIPLLRELAGSLVLTATK